MKKKTRADIYRRFSHVLISALLGQARLSVTLSVYTAIALLLLGYVSAQVYTSVLGQEIAELKQVTSDHKEQLNKLTSDYISLSSRAPVSKYCKSVLGMVAASDGNVERFAMDKSDRNSFDLVEFAGRYSPIADAYLYALRARGDNLRSQ